jgi:hypothetical protein
MAIYPVLSVNATALGRTHRLKREMQRSASRPRSQIRVCGGAANNSIDPLSASAFVRPQIEALANARP